MKKLNKQEIKVLYQTLQLHEQEFEQSIAIHKERIRKLSYNTNITEKDYESVTKMLDECLEKKEILSNLVAWVEDMEEFYL